MKITQKITIDIENFYSYRCSVNAKQNDNDTREILAYLTKNGEKFEFPSEATAKIRCVKPDGTFCQNEALTDPKEGTVCFVLTEQMLACPGCVTADIALSVDQELLSTVTFQILVAQLPEGINRPSTNEFMELEHLVRDAREAADRSEKEASSAIAAAQAAATIKIDSTLSKAGQAAESLITGEKLNNRLELLQNLLNPDDPDILTGGYLDRMNRFCVSANLMESGYIPCHAGESFSRNDRSDRPINTHIVFFTKDHKNCGGIYEDQKPYFTVPNQSEIAFFRIPISSFKHRTSAIYKTLDILPFVPFGKTIAVADKIFSEGVHANYFSAEDFDSRNVIAPYPVRNMFDPNDPEIITGGSLREGKFVPNEGLIETGYIPCRPGDCFRWMGAKRPFRSAVQLYDKSKQYIGQHYEGQSSDSWVTIPNRPEVAYIRFPKTAEDRFKTALYNTKNLICTFLPYEKEILYFPEFTTETFTTYTDQSDLQRNQWVDKKWYAYGTSMTSVQQGAYVPVVQKLSGMKAVNKGIPGGSLTPDGYGKGNVKQAVMTMQDGKGEADLITLEVLPNEGKVIGEIYDTDDESFCGCFNQCLRFLQEHTNAQIVTIIMIGSKDTLPETVPASGMTNYEFAQKIREVSQLNGVPVIDVFAESGFGHCRVKNGAYQTDHIHLNQLGGENMGRFIWSKLKDIPLWVSA